MRAAFSIIAIALALGACGPASQTAASSSAPASSGAPAIAATTPAAKKSPFPEWQLIANQEGGGGVFYNPSSMTRAADGSTGDVWVEIRYNDEKTYVREDKTTRQTVTYNRERILFRFNCRNTNFVILERRLMGSGEEIAESIKTPAKSERDWHPANDGGVSAVTFGPACQSAMK